MEGEFSLKRFLGHHCPDLNQLHVPLNTRVIRNALWSHFERFTCHLDDEIVSRTHRHNGMILGDEDSAPVFACQFSRDGLGGHLLATGDEHGQVMLMDTRKRAQQSVIEEFMAHRNAIHEICWNRNGSELVTASADNTLKLWDVNCLCKELSTLRGHQGTIKSVDVHRDEPTMIVSGGRDGMVAVWDTRYNNRGTHHSPLHTSHCRSPQAVTRKKFRAFVQKELSARASVTAVRFLGDHGILSSGIDGVIKQWDKRFLSEACRVFEAPKKLGITALALDSSHTQLFASCKDSKIYAFDCMKLQKTPVAQYGSHAVSSYYVKITLSSDDRYLLSGSSYVGMFVNGGYIWEVNNKEGVDYCMEPLMTLPGQGGEVTAVAWCPSELSKVVTCSDNHDTWIWRTSNNNNSDKIISQAAQYGVRGHLKICSRIHTPLSSPSNSTDVEEVEAVKNQLHDISNCEVTIPATTPPIKCFSGNCESKQMTPPGCINDDINSITSSSHSLKRTATVHCTKQTTIPMLYSLTNQTPTNSFTQPSADVEDKAIVKNHACKNNKATTVTAPPIECINSNYTSNGGSYMTVNESRKRRMPLKCITNVSLSLTPKRKANINHTKQVTLSDTFAQQERK